MARAAALALSAAALSAAIAAPARAGWNQPFRVSQPTSVDNLPADVEFASGGTAAITFGVQNADLAVHSSGFAALGAAGGGLTGPRRVPGAGQVLDLSFDGSAFELLTGAGSAGPQCCRSAQVVRMMSDGSFGRPRTLVGHLAGAVLGRLTPLAGGRMLAAIATDRGVWSAQSGFADRFAPAHRLTDSGVQPETLAATSLDGDHSIIAWTANSGDPGSGPPVSIAYAQGSSSQAPRRRRLALSVADGHGITELGLAPARSRPTFAWTETWYDATGAYRSVAVAADLGGVLGARAFGVAGEAASGLSLASDANADQVLTWKSCTFYGSCSVRVAWRRGGGRFGAPARLGAIDASQTPAASLSPSGEALVGWVSDGHVFAASHPVRARRFRPSHAVSRTNFASDLALSFGPQGEAIAAWTQGTLSPSIVAAVYRTP